MSEALHPRPHPDLGSSPRSKRRRPLRGVAVKAHRYLGIVAAAFWLLQAVTGMICVFHWEIDDATLAAPTRPLDLDAMERRVAVLAPSGSGRRVSTIWTSAGAPGRWDVTIEGRSPEVARIDDAGGMLRERPDGELVADGGLLDTIDQLHQNLLAGDVGAWIVGVSGLLLLTNVFAGLIAAWPQRGRWRIALTPLTRGPPRSRLYGLHRSLGLWLAAPALVLVTTGVLSVFSDGFDRLIGASSEAIPSSRPDGRSIGMAAAVRVALARHPNAELAMIGFPPTGDATWTIGLLEPGELRRAYGRSSVAVDGRDGRVLADYAAPRASAARRIADAVFPIHTGEAAGVGGRLAVLALGAWLTTMIVVGLRLWWLRTAKRRAAT